MGSPVDIKSCPAGPGPLGTKSAGEGDRHSPPFPLVVGMPAMELTGELGCEGHSLTRDHSKSAVGPWATPYPREFLLLVGSLSRPSLRTGSLWTVVEALGTRN